MKLYAISLLTMGALLSQTTAETPPSGTKFISSGKEEYRFDTGIIRGTLRNGGKSYGLSSLVHLPSGTGLNGARYGIFSHYRVFTTNKRYGPAAWDWPSTSRLLSDGAVQIDWPAGKDHPFELRAVYRWSGADTLDLETTVKAQEDLPQFESYLASYFHEDFPGSSVYVGKDSGSGFATTERSFGHWQMFPRNAEAATLIDDGRWQKHPSPVTWKIRQQLAAPIGIRRNEKNGLCAVLMAPPGDCFAMSTPYHGEGHFSLYFSLFGRDVKAGETATVRTRLIIASRPAEEQILAWYKSYIRDLLGPGWPFYAFCMATHDAKKRTLAQQATMLKEAGYDGCGHLWLGNTEARAKTLSDADLRLFQVYMNVLLNKPQPVDEERVAAVLPSLQQHGSQLALLIKGGEPSDSKLDDEAVAVINRIADMAKPYGVTIVLYPHQRDWLETCSDAVRIAKKVNRPGEVGAMFNLCHWMLVDRNRDLRSMLKEAQPWLMAVSLSGSDKPEQVYATKKNFIQPLGRGSYDIADFLRILRDIRYSGPIGLQCYGLGGDARLHLEESMGAWKRLMDQ